MKLVLVFFVLLAASCSYAQNLGCECDTYDLCACCVANIPLIDSICANLTWNSEALSITVEILINNAVVWKQVVTDPQPLSACFKIGCQVCFDMSNLNITTQGACGNMGFNLSCGFFESNWNLGDFYLGANCTIPTEMDYNIVNPVLQKQPVLLGNGLLPKQKSWNDISKKLQRNVDDVFQVKEKKTVQLQ